MRKILFWLLAFAGIIATCLDAADIRPVVSGCPPCSGGDGGTWEREFTIADPANMPTDAVRATLSIPIAGNATGETVTISEIQAWSDTDNYGFTIYKSGGEYDFGTTNDVRVDAVSCATDGDGCFYSEITSGFDSETLEDGRSIIFEHTTGNAGWVRVRISGTY